MHPKFGLIHYLRPWFTIIKKVHSWRRKKKTRKNIKITLVAFKALHEILYVKTISYTNTLNSSTQKIKISSMIFPQSSSFIWWLSIFHCSPEFIYHNTRYLEYERDRKKGEINYVYRNEMTLQIIINYMVQVQHHVHCLVSYDGNHHNGL